MGTLVTTVKRLQVPKERRIEDELNIKCEVNLECHKQNERSPKTIKIEGFI